MYLICWVTPALRPQLSKFLFHLSSWGTRSHPDDNLVLGVRCCHPNCYFHQNVTCVACEFPLLLEQTSETCTTCRRASESKQSPVIPPPNTTSLARNEGGKDCSFDYFWQISHFREVNLKGFSAWRRVSEGQKDQVCTISCGVTTGKF